MLQSVTNTNGPAHLRYRFLRGAVELQRLLRLPRSVGCQRRRHLLLPFLHVERRVARPVNYGNVA